ncbi:MAG: hypothetical protein ACKVOK_13470 [Flavobacteriales bacterium]
MRKLFQNVVLATGLLIASGVSQAQVNQGAPPTQPKTKEEILKQEKPQSEDLIDPKFTKKEVSDEERSKLERKERMDRMKQNLPDEVFPKGTVWINTDFPVGSNMFSEKIMLIVFSDFNCPECAYGLSALEDELKMAPAYQIIEVIKGDTANPVSRNFIMQYVQQYAFTHPIAIVSEYPALGENKLSEIPSFAMFQKSKIPGFISSGATGLEDMKKRIKSVSTNAEYIRSCNTFQTSCAVAPHCWADPVVENPTYIAPNESDGSMFVVDAAHNRIVELDKAGYCTRTIGSSYYGFADDVLSNAKFDHPHGICYFNGNLYIADTYNHRIREADIQGDRVRSVLGNGTSPIQAGDVVKGGVDAIGLPIDVIEWNGKLFVASASSNRIYEFDTKSGEAKKFVDVNAGKTGMKRATIVNLSAGKSVLYAVLSNGSYVQIDKKGTQLAFPMKPKMGVTSIVEWNGEVIGTNAEGNRILMNGKDGWKSIAGTGVVGDVNGLANESTFTMPFDLANFNGELIVSDRENHRLRKLNSSKEGKVRNYPIAGTMEVVVEMAAHTEGEMVVMDTVFIGNRESTITVALDLAGYKMVESGRNEIDINDLPGAYIKDYSIKDDKFSFQVNNKFTGYDVYVEVYMLVESPAHPGVFVAKRAYLAFVVERKADAPVQQEQLYKVNLLPQ